MLTRLPRYTLFPYTTLFRSHPVDLAAVLLRLAHQRGDRVLRDEMVFLLDIAALMREADRKSTRLNSSHTVISYAVFCLKKKKMKTTEENDDNAEITHTEPLI